MQAGILKQGDLVITNDDHKPLHQLYIVGEIRVCSKVEQVLLLKQISPTEVRKNCWFPTELLARPSAYDLKVHDYKMRHPNDETLSKAP